MTASPSEPLAPLWQRQETAAPWAGSFSADRQAQRSMRWTDAADERGQLKGLPRGEATILSSERVGETGAAWDCAAPQPRFLSATGDMSTPARRAALRPDFNRPARHLAASAPQHWRSMRPSIGAATGSCGPLTDIDQGGGSAQNELRSGSHHDDGGEPSSRGDPSTVESFSGSALHATVHAAAGLRDSVAGRAPEAAVEGLSGALDALTARVQPLAVPQADGCAAAGQVMPACSTTPALFQQRCLLVDKQV